MNVERPLFEEELESDETDPNEIPIKDRKVSTQPYDLVVESLYEQIRANTIFLRPISERPKFQRKYVWNNKLASKLIESILLNVPIPPCYLSQNEDFELDVIDGQQRLYSIYRYIDNQFSLTNLEVLQEYNGLRFHELPQRAQRQFKTHTMRCVLISNESHPEIKFDVFERLNTNTVPLNAQELRNCVYRGTLNAILQSASEYKPWLSILGRKEPDKRLRDEEQILRFYAFTLHGLDSYRTPQKHWLNEAAKVGRKYTPERGQELLELWHATIDKCLVLFDPKECFRRPGGRAVNKALFDLIAHFVQDRSLAQLQKYRQEFRHAYEQLLNEEEFDDLISRAVDHTRRTKRRFELWEETLGQLPN